MRERVTYVLRKGQSDFKPDQIDVAKSSLAVSKLDAVKEHHVTFSSDEIPASIWRVLRNCHELHIRWSTSQSYASIDPYASRLPPGLHVSFTPLEGRSAKRLCSLLKDAFGQRLKCDSVEAAFTTPPILSSRFASTASRQYFYYLSSLLDFSTFIQQKICGEDGIPCRLRAHELQKADTFDLDFDAISQSLILKALWTKPNGDDGKWYETHLKGSSTSDTLEVGILVNEPPEEPETLRYSGFLTQVGKDTTPSSTLFSFPSRHHNIPPETPFSYSASFTEPTGLHPTLTLSFSPHPTPPADECFLHTYLTLPSYLFLDPYPFRDTLFLSSHQVRSLRALSGATDLEAPDWTTPQWGSAALLELDVPTASSSKNALKIELPLHLRYLSPLNASHVLTPVPWPAVFWACASQHSGAKFAAAPFDRVDLGFDGLFGPNTVFYHASPDTSGRAVSTLSVPVLDMRAAKGVQMGTVVAVVLGTVWILWVLGRGVWRNGVSGKSTKERRTSEKKRA